MDKSDINNDEKIFRIPIPATKVPQKLKDYGLWALTMFAYSPEIELSRKSFFELCPKRSFSFYVLAHMHGGYGHLWLPGFESDLKPGDLILLTPHTLNRFGGYKNKRFLEDNITFFGPVADMMAKAGVIRSGLYHIGQVRVLRVIQEYLKDPSIDNQIRGLLELQNFLVKLYLENAVTPPLHPMFEQMLASIRENPEKWWTVRELAEMCKCTPDHLRRLFLANTGTAPKLYIDRLKLTQAADMLLNTDMGICEIARTFGYMDPYHFSRRFKEILGVSPRSYRKERKLL